MTVAFLGLGTMGYRMAGRLAGAGLDVRVYNRSADVAARWVAEHGGSAHGTPAAAAAGAPVVLACLGDDSAVRHVAGGKEGAFRTMTAGAVFVDHSTGSAALARELAARAQQSGLAFLDAPVTGGRPGAEKGTLTTMVGGAADALERVRPIVSRYAPRIFHVGESGAGQIAKMANQICIGGIVQSLAEAFALVERSGLSTQKVFEVLLTGSARSWQMEARGPNMLSASYDFGFSVEWMAKDLRICLEQAKHAGLELRSTAGVESALRELDDRGFKDEDIGALMRLYR